jgi:hypothetical protein
VWAPVITIATDAMVGTLLPSGLSETALKRCNTKSR